jgi:tetratricopeptide (TPR) repeat protein
MALPPAVRADEFAVGQIVLPKPAATANQEGAKPGLTPILLPMPVKAIEGDRLSVGEAWILKKDVQSLDQAIDFYTAEIRKNPKDAAAWTQRALASSAKGDPAKAIKDFTESLRLGMTDINAYAGRGAAFLATGEIDNAIKDLTKALEIDPRNAAVYSDRGIAWTCKSDYDKAIKDLSEAIKLNPQNSLAFSARAEAWKIKHEFAKAAEDYATTAQLDPKDSDAHNECAWILATCPVAGVRNGAKAVVHATKACELEDWKNGDFLETLAAACAEQGDFPAAIKWQTKALDLAPTAADRIALQEQMALYKAGKPYREELPK